MKKKLVSKDPGMPDYGLGCLLKNSFWMNQDFIWIIFQNPTLNRVVLCW